MTGIIFKETFEVLATGFGSAGDDEQPESSSRDLLSKEQRTITVNILDQPVESYESMPRWL